MKKAVIFDMDGVLVDNKELHIDAYITFCERYGVAVKREDILKCFGMIFPHKPKSKFLFVLLSRQRHPGRVVVP